MTLSNFDWTDKDSVKWFILLPSGHEGPYSLYELIEHKEKKKLSQDIKIWAEGLSEPITLDRATALSFEVKTQVIEETPDLPPLPEDDLPPLPLEASEESEEPEEVPEVKKSSPKIWIGAALSVVVAAAGGVFLMARGQEKIDIRRMPKMSLETHEKIRRENTFESWGKKIFFKEYLPQDHSHIWLVTSSFQECDVEATFSSVKDKLLTMEDEKVSFKSQGQLKGHVSELSSFDFTTGSKIIPGLYEMDVRATNCKWEGFFPLVMNAFQGPDAEYMARTKVILFAKGADEFNSNLANLLKKKDELDRREKDANYLFWKDLEQKFQTLEAISLQIEQHFLDFLDEDRAQFQKNLKPMVDDYTRKFGSFLTSFVVENEKYFKSMNSKGDAEKRNYELMVRLTAKTVGEESMKYIEEFQKLKAPKENEIIALSERVKKTFSGLKKNISGKLTQVSLDQEK